MIETARASFDASQRPRIENPKFFDLLQENGIIDGEFIRDLLDEFDGNALDVLATLIQSGVGTKRQLCQLWCDSIGIAHVDLEKTLFQPHIVRKIPERFARLYYTIAVYQMGETVTVATATPDNREIARALEQIMGGPVSLVFALPHDIETAIENAYQAHGPIHDFFNKIAAGKTIKAGGPVTAKSLSESAGADAINQLHVAAILYGALENACEIHLVAGPETAAINYLANEQAIHRIGLEKGIYEHLLARIKAMAGMDPAPVSAPRFGRVLLPVPGKKLDVQLECRPAPEGETLLLKLAGRRTFQKLHSIDSLHLAHRIRGPLESRLDSPSGLFLIAGPARAGKSTLAYAMLGELRKRGRKIITIENQIKFLLPGIDQYQVNPEAGFPASVHFDAILKLSPDVVFLQDLTDMETGSALAQAASGRLVIAGVQAADASAAFKIALAQGSAGAVCGVLVQHLAARLCDHCKQSYTLPPKLAGMLFAPEPTTGVTAWREKGCAYCKNTGFSGRIGLHELLLLNPEAGKQVEEGAVSEAICEAAGSGNHYSLRYDGIKKVLRGLTTFNEVERLQAQG